MAGQAKQAVSQGADRVAEEAPQRAQQVRSHSGRQGQEAACRLAGYCWHWSLGLLKELPFNAITG